MIGIPDVRLVPDDPVVDAAGIPLDQGAEESSPAVIGVLVTEVEPLGDAQPAPGVGSPARSVDHQADHLPPLREFQIQLLVGDGQVPLLRHVGLDLVPTETDAGPACAQLGRGPRRVVGLDHAKTIVGGSSLGGRAREAERENRCDEQE